MKVLSEVDKHSVIISPMVIDLKFSVILKEMTEELVRNRKRPT